MIKVSRADTKSYNSANWSLLLQSLFGTIKFGGKSFMSIAWSFLFGGQFLIKEGSSIGSLTHLLSQILMSATPSLPSRISIPSWFGSHEILLR